MVQIHLAAPDLDQPSRRKDAHYRAKNRWRTIAIRFRRRKLAAIHGATWIFSVPLRAS